jgi:hypothetical protein
MALARWQATITDESGTVVPSASVTIRDALNNLVTIWTDAAGTVGAGNPFAADANGYAFGYMVAGIYKITAVSGALTREWLDVFVGAPSPAVTDGGLIDLSKLGIASVPIGTTPTVDVTSLLQAEFSKILAGTASGITGDPGRVYGFTSQLVCGAQNFHFKNINLEVIGGTWATNEAALILGENTAGTDKFSGCDVANVTVEGNHIGKGGIHWLAITASDIHNVKANRFLDYQQRVGDATVGDSASCTGARFFGISGFEWDFGEGLGEDDTTLRTAKGLWLESADFNMWGGGFNKCLQSFYGGDYFNATIIGSTFYAGKTRTDPNAVSVYVSEDANRTKFLNCRIDDGATIIRNMNTSIQNCEFIQYTGGSVVRLVALVANEDAAQFIFTGNDVQGNTNSIELLTEGVGTWATGVLIPNFNDNRIGDGLGYFMDGIANYAGGGVAIESAATEYRNFTANPYDLKCTRDIRISADYPANSPGQDSLYIATAGVDRFEFDGSGHLLPSVDIASRVGDSTKRLSNVFASKLTVIDGTTSPTTVAGHSQIFVDTSDGIAKIKHGDGTEKSLETNLLVNSLAGSGNLLFSSPNWLTTGGTFTLPAASSKPAGSFLDVDVPDRYAAFTQIISRAGSDTIHNASGSNTTVTIGSGASAFVRFVTNGVSEWTY